MVKRRNLSLKSKKGNAILDSIMVIVVLFSFGLITFFGYYILSEVNTDIQADTTINQTSKDIVNNLETSYPTVMDGLFIFVFVLLWCLVLVASFFVDAHPIFFIFTVILLIVVIIVSALLSNAFEEVTLDASVSSVRSSFPMTMFIMGHLVEVILAIAFTVMLALFGKAQLQ